MKPQQLTHATIMRSNKREMTQYPEDPSLSPHSLSGFFVTTNIPSVVPFRTQQHVAWLLSSLLISGEFFISFSGSRAPFSEWLGHAVYVTAVALFFYVVVVASFYYFGCYFTAFVKPLTQLIFFLIFIIFLLTRKLWRWYYFILFSLWFVTCSRKV